MVFQLIDHEKKIVTDKKTTAKSELETAKQTELRLRSQADTAGIANGYAAEHIDTMIRRFNLSDLPVSDLEIIPDFKSLFSTGDLLQTYGNFLKKDDVKYKFSESFSEESPQWFFIRGFNETKNEIDLFHLNYNEYNSRGWGNEEKRPINLLECTYNMKEEENVNTQEYTIIKLNAEGLKIIFCWKEKTYTTEEGVVPPPIFKKTLTYDKDISELLPVKGLTFENISVIFSARNKHSDAVTNSEMYKKLRELNSFD